MNVLNPWGTASKEVADQVYKCTGCRGSVDCTSAKYPNGTVCSDGNPCTWGDTCQNKVCTPDPNRATQCSASDQCHNAGICDITSGQCSNPAKGDGTTCDDGNACTQTDSCQGGTCTGTNLMTCAPGDQCHLGVCDPGSGACTNPPAQDGTACNDGNACTQTDTCLLGVCMGGNPVTCGGADGCHNAGSCDPTSGTCGGPTQIDKIGFIARSGDCEGNGVAAAPGAGKALRASSASLRPYG